MTLERITRREWRAIGQALGFALAESDPDLGHDQDAMESAHIKVSARGWPAAGSSPVPEEATDG